MLWLKKTFCSVPGNCCVDYIGRAKLLLKIKWGSGNITRRLLFTLFCGFPPAYIVNSQHQLVGFHVYAKHSAVR